DIDHVHRDALQLAQVYDIVDVVRHADLWVELIQVDLDAPLVHGAVLDTQPAGALQAARRGMRLPAHAGRRDDAGLAADLDRERRQRHTVADRQKVHAVPLDRLI